MLNDADRQGNPLVTYSRYEDYLFLLSVCFPLATIDAEVPFPLHHYCSNPRKGLGEGHFQKPAENTACTKDQVTPSEWSPSL